MEQLASAKAQYRLVTVPAQTMCRLVSLNDNNSHNRFDLRSLQNTRMTRTIYHPLYIFIAIAALLPLQLNAESPSYLGTAGVLRVPSAKIPTLGQFNYQFNTTSDIPREFPNTNNHVINIGFANTFEIGGRLTDWYETRARLENGTRTGFRDLSGNLKWRLPLNLDRIGISVGVIDFAGEAIQLRSLYAVATAGIQKAEISVGFANGGSARALDGVFAGARLKLHPNVHALADYSNDSVGFGIDLIREFDRFSVSALLSADRTSEGEWNRAAGLSISAPLDQKRRKRPLNTHSHAIVLESRDLQKLASRLSAEGFTQIAITTDDLGDTISFSNQIYNHTEMDALVQVLNIAYQYTGNTPRLTAQLRKSNFPVASISTPVTTLGDFLQGKISADNFFDNAELKGPGEYENTVASADAPDYMAAEKTRLVDVRLQPDLRTAVGTEQGVFHYSAALRADVKIPLPRHFSLLASYSVPVTHSDRYNNGEVFAGSRHRPLLNNAVIQRFGFISQRFPYLLSIGYQSVQQNDYLVVKQESAHFINQGRGMFLGKFSFLASQDDLDDELLATVGYTHLWDNKTFGFGVEAGQFFAEERGTKLELFRFFGNARVTTFINYADANDIVGGLRIGIPLTPSKDKKVNNALVVRGSQFWQYETRTTIKDPDFPGTNRLRPNQLFEPTLSYTLAKDYLNNGRYAVESLTNH